MKIWRKQGTKPIKDEAQEEVAEEELTDISQTSTPEKKEPKKDKMEEIYSTKDKQVKYKRQTPLEAEEAAKRTQQAKAVLTSGKAEITLNTPVQEDGFIELTSDFEEGTVIAEDIIEDVDQFSTPHSVHIQDIEEIDIDLDASTTVKKYERQTGSTTRHDERYKKTFEHEYERIFGRPKYDVTGEKIVAKIPTYQHESKINQIHLKAGRFTDVVESEYDEYLKSNDPTISKKHPNSHKDNEPKQSLLYTLSQLAHQKAEEPHQKAQEPSATKSKPKAKKPKSKFKKFFKILFTLIFPTSHSGTSSGYENKTIDYQNRQDEKHVVKEISSNFKKLAIRAGILGVLFAFSFVLSMMERIAGDKLFSGMAYGTLVYCGINLLVLIVTGIVARPFIISGLRPLRNLRGNSDSAVACAFLACMLQQIFAMFFSDLFVGSTLHLYTTIVVLGFMLNTLGRLLIVSRVKTNFKFITSKSPANAAKILSDEDTARKMLSGTSAAHSVVAYQHPTKLLSDFLKISYAPDPSEDLSGKLSPITLITSIFVSVVYGIIDKSFIGALCAFAVMCCISIPLCALLTGNVPLKVMCNDMLNHGAMLSGYPSIKQFGDSDAVIVDAMSLYPKGCIKLNSFKHFVDYRIEDSLLAAAVILKEANSPLYRVFDDLLEKNAHNLPKVESVLYEDKLGLVGWVNGERILIGNRKLLDRFHIYVEDAADETRYTKRGKDVTYIACAGQLVSLMVCTYAPDEQLKNELIRAQNNGVCLVVYTTDSNVTQEKLSHDYELFYRTVKVLSTGFAQTCSELCDHKEESSRAYLATRGRFSSLLHAVTGAISFKQNLTIGLIIQIFGLVLGVLLCATMVLYATVMRLGVVELLLYMIFWGIASIVVQFIKRP